MQQTAKCTEVNIVEIIFFFFFEDRTSFFFCSVLGISGTRYEEEIIGQSCALDECIKQGENKGGAISLNVCLRCLKKWNHPSRVHLLRKNTQLIRDSQKHVFQTISSQRQWTNTLQSHVLSFHPPSSCQLGSLTKRKYSKKITQEVPGRGGGCQRIVLQSSNLDTVC